MRRTWSATATTSLSWPWRAWSITPSEAAETLASEGIDCELIDPRTTSPLDEDTILESVERTGRLVVVDEATPRCSMAADIAALVADKAFGALKAPIRRVTAPHTPGAVRAGA